MISYEKFVSYCKNFKDKIDQYDEGWNLFNEKDYFGLCKTTCISVPHEVNVNVEVDDMCIMEHSEATYTTCQMSSSLTVLELNVLYNIAFSTPILYFLCYKDDGVPLPYDDIWKLLSSSPHKDLFENKWDFICQEMHPAFGVPYFFVHPCRTANIMNTIGNKNEKSYIAIWLNYFASFLGINIPAEFFI